MLELAARIGDAVDAELAGVREQLDAELALQVIALHRTAMTTPANGECDRRTVGMKKYSQILLRDQVEPGHLADAVERMFKDSLPPDFLKWTGRFCADHPLVVEAEIAERLTEFQVFVALRSVTSNEAEIDELQQIAEKARVAADEALVRYKKTNEQAKAKLVKFQVARDEARRLLYRATQLTDNVDALTVHTPDSFRRCVLDAQEKYLCGLANPKDKSKPAAATGQNGEKP